MDIGEEFSADLNMNMVKLRDAILTAESSESERKSFSDDPHSYLQSRGVGDFICQVGLTQARFSDIVMQVNQTARLAVA